MIILRRLLGLLIVFIASSCLLFEIDTLDTLFSYEARIFDVSRFLLALSMLLAGTMRTMGQTV